MEKININDIHLSFDNFPCGVPSKRKLCTGNQGTNDTIVTDVDQNNLFDCNYAGKMDCQEQSDVEMNMMEK